MLAKAKTLRFSLIISNNKIHYFYILFFSFKIFFFSFLPRPRRTSKLETNNQNQNPTVLSVSQIKFISLSHMHLSSHSLKNKLKPHYDKQSAHERTTRCVRCTLEQAPSLLPTPSHTRSPFCSSLHKNINIFSTCAKNKTKHPLFSTTVARRNAAFDSFVSFLLCVLSPL